MYLQPNEMSANSIIAIEFTGGVTSKFFINKITESIHDKGVICIHGRLTDDLIKNCDFFNIENDKDLTIYKVTPSGSKFSHKKVKGYRKLSTPEKVVILNEIKDFDKVGSDNAQKIHKFFYKALFRSKVGRSIDYNKDQSASV